MTTDVKTVAAEIERHLNEIAPLFVPGVRFTFIARVPGNDEADMLLTIDDLVMVKRLIQRRIDR